MQTSLYCRALGSPVGTTSMQILCKIQQAIIVVGTLASIAIAVLRMKTRAIASLLNVIILELPPIWNWSLICPGEDSHMERSGMNVVPLRGCLHDTGMTFIPVRVHPGSHLWLCICLHDTGTKCRTGTSSLRFLYRYESFVPVWRLTTFRTGIM